MALETATHISDLVAANPAGTDGINQADDHIRLIKQTILTTFPSITGPVTDTHTVINGWEARIAAIEGDYIKPDGSVAMTGAFDAGSQLLSNVLDPVSAQDAATKSWTAAEDIALAVTLTTAMENLFPVGTIYTNISNSTNPGTLLGFGTWVAFAEGRVLVGVGTSSNDENAESRSFTAGVEDGRYRHTLTVSETPAHTHTINEYTRNGSSGNLSDFGDTGDIGSTKTTSSSGGDGAHENVQPNIAVYMWKRTV